MREIFEKMEKSELVTLVITALLTVGLLSYYLYNCLHPVEKYSPEYFTTNTISEVEPFAGCGGDCPPAPLPPPPAAPTPGHAAVRHSPGRPDRCSAATCRPRARTRGCAPAHRESCPRWLAPRAPLPSRRSQGRR